MDMLRASKNSLALSFSVRLSCSINTHAVASIDVVVDLLLEPSDKSIKEKQKKGTISIGALRVRYWRLSRISRAIDSNLINHVRLCKETKYVVQVIRV
jgi:hypothetical protein